MEFEWKHPEGFWARYSWSLRQLVSSLFNIILQLFAITNDPEAAVQINWTKPTMMVAWFLSMVLPADLKMLTV